MKEDKVKVSKTEFSLFYLLLLVIMSRISHPIIIRQICIDNDSVQGEKRWKKICKINLHIDSMQTAAKKNDEGKKGRNQYSSAFFTEPMQHIWFIRIFQVSRPNERTKNSSYFCFNGFLEKNRLRKGPFFLPINWIKIAWIDTISIGKHFINTKSRGHSFVNV